MKKTPSLYQARVYENVATGKGHTVVQARAGSGKTTTIMGALASVPKGCTVALFAFNKSIAVELGSRGPKGVEVKTLHAHGFSAVRRAFPGVKVETDKSMMICVDLFGEPVRDHELFGRYRSIADIVSKAKDTLVAFGNVDALDALIDRFDIDAPADFDTRAEFVAMAMKVFVRSAEITNAIDFSDMCWLPVVLRLRVWSFDRVFVDETQDLSPSQIELLLMCVKKGGRICAVGDDRQAIYAFRGADINTIPNLIGRLDATVLPLSVTYRCCLAVVRLAQREVPDLEAAPNAVEGVVRSGVSENTMVDQASPGDMIISRSNAPLMGFCLKFLKSGKRAAIKGKEVGTGILRLIERSKAKTVDDLIVWLDAWHKKETARLVKRDRSTDEVDDRVACVYALTEDAADLSVVLERARMLFVKDEDSDAGRITLGTTHKLKGLEADRVWMLADTYRPNRGGECANCWYVAVSRAKSELNLVITKKGMGQ